MDGYLFEHAMKLLKEIADSPDGKMEYAVIEKRGSIDVEIANDLFEQGHLLKVDWYGESITEVSFGIGFKSYQVSEKGRLLLAHRKKQSRVNALKKVGKTCIFIASLIGNVIALLPQILDLLQQIPSLLHGIK